MLRLSGRIAASVPADGSCLNVISALSYDHSVAANTTQSGQREAQAIHFLQLRTLKQRRRHDL
eukprot:3249038-Amphidinium_carterae.1